MLEAIDLTSGFLEGTYGPVARGVARGASLKECFDEAFLNGPTVVNPSGKVPDDEEIPLLLDNVYPCHEVVKIDYHLPGCPPSADTLWAALTALLSDEPVELPYSLIKYD